MDMTNFTLNFGTTMQSPTMVYNFQECAKKLVLMVQDLVIVARRTVTSAFTRTEVVQGIILLQPPPNSMAIEFDDMTAIPSIPQEIDQSESTFLF